MTQARIRERVRQIQERVRKQRRFAELEKETRECYESIIGRHPLPEEYQQYLEREWKLGLKVIVEYEDATTPEDYHELSIYTYDSRTLSDYAESEMDERFMRANLDLANALGLAMVTIDEAGNITGEIIEY